MKISVLEEWPNYHGHLYSAYLLCSWNQAIKSLWLAQMCRSQQDPRIVELLKKLKEFKKTAESYLTSKIMTEFQDLVSCKELKSQR